MENSKLLDKVMSRLKHQFIVPATYTLHQTKEGISVHIYLHGATISHYSLMEELFSVVDQEEEEIRKVNAISDYLIDYFIVAMKEEEELEAIMDVAHNLGFVYEQPVQAIRWMDPETKESFVSFIPLKKEVAVTISSSQLKNEYNQRFESENTPDIVVDLSKIIQLIESDKYDEAKEFAVNLKRDIYVKKMDQCSHLKEIL